MSTFYLLQIRVKDAAKLEQYSVAAPATVMAHGGKLVFRGRVSGVASGSPVHSSAVVLEFPDTDSAEGWYTSKEYQALTGNRDAAADVVATRFDETDFY